MTTTRRIRSTRPTRSERRHRDAMQALACSVVLTCAGLFILWAALAPAWEDADGVPTVRALMAALGVLSTLGGCVLCAAVSLSAD